MPTWTKKILLTILRPPDNCETCRQAPEKLFYFSLYLQTQMLNPPDSSASWIPACLQLTAMKIGVPVERVLRDSEKHRRTTKKCCKGTQYRVTMKIWFHRTRERCKLQEWLWCYQVSSPGFWCWLDVISEHPRLKERPIVISTGLDPRIVRLEVER